MSLNPHNPLLYFNYNIFTGRTARQKSSFLFVSLKYLNLAHYQKIIPQSLIEERVWKTHIEILTTS